MRFDRYDKVIYDLSSPGRTGVTLPDLSVPEDPGLASLGHLLRQDLPLPEVAEPEVVRHFVALSRKNYHIDLGFYPLGSCTMKYNPKINEDCAGLPGFAGLHPLTPAEKAQGALAVIYQLTRFLCDLTGLDDATMQPAAGAQGELTALMMIKAFYESRGETRTEVLTPDSAHGTNPASAAMVGFTVQEIKSNERGRVDMAHLAKLLSRKTACVMVTNPNTLGLFEEDIQEIARLTHEMGAQLYMDGANMNALLGRIRPGDMGFDCMHINLHKTFSTPHGGGGPGAGPVMVKSHLAPFLPVPRIVRHRIETPSKAPVDTPSSPGEVDPRAKLAQLEGFNYAFDYDHPRSVGKVHSHYGNFGMLVRAYTYILSLGLEGLTRISGVAVLNANYLREKLRGDYFVPHTGRCMHEFVIKGTTLKEHDIRTMDVAKRLLDHGFHAPTIYFPLIVEEAMMIEPTESESKETLDAFVTAMKTILAEAKRDPELVRTSPHTTPVRRLDETKAARHPILTHQDALKAGQATREA
jgi:glycine dehydrogenase subunit 2